MAEVRIYIKNTTDIDLAELNPQVGDKAEVIGILSETSTGFRLLPRYKSDIKLEAGSGKQEAGNKKRENDWKNYLIATLIAIVIIFVGIMYKKRNKIQETRNK